MIQVGRLGSQIGVEISGIDVRTLDDADFGIIYRAWRNAPPALHPLLTTHPEIGRRVLYFDPNKILHSIKEAA